MNLFPSDYYDNEKEINTEELNDDEIEWKSSYKFNFEKGEFEIEPNGSIRVCNREENYIQWCNKALATPRFKMGYSFSYGQDFKELIGSSMDKKAIQLEITRMITECLIVHPLTKEITEFNFEWSNNKSEVYVTFNIITTENSNFILNTKVPL